MSDTPRGYEPHNPTSPTLALDGVTWVPLRIVPPGDPKFIEWVANMAAERARLRPWTLVSLSDFGVLSASSSACSCS